MGLPCDWQLKKQVLLERSQYLLETGQWSDCKFIVGQEPHQQTLKGHKLFLAMSSPVFEAMFFGSMAEKNDLIHIRDVQPEAFKILLKYIYTDRVDINSFELACELCYCAKKYMLPTLVKQCTRYLWSDIAPKKACRAYEFAKLFEEPVLTEKCLRIICTKTKEILKESNWEEIELGTLLTVLDQEDLQINSEVELFTAVERWAKAECTRKSLDPNDGKALKSVIGNALSKIRFLSLSPQEFAEGPGMSPLLTQDETFAVLMNILCSGNKAPMPEGFSTNLNGRNIPLNARSARSGLCSKHRDIRPGPPNLHNKWAVPLGDCQSSYVNDVESNDTPPITDNGVRNNPGNWILNNSPPVIINGAIREGLRYYCQRSILQPSECMNTDILDCSVTFTVDKNICVLGIQVPTQIFHPTGGDRRILYREILYANLLDSDNTRLTYTHFTTEVNTDSLVEIMFDRPVYIQKHKMYRIGVSFNKYGRYPIGICTQYVLSESVLFSFGVGKSTDNIRHSLIRSIIFAYHGNM